MNKLILISLLLCGQFLLAQNYKFGKVSLRELKQTEHPIEADAPAAILYKSIISKIVFNGTFRLESRYQYRIKVYKEDGIKHGSLVQRLRQNDGYTETLSKLRVNVFEYSNGKVTLAKYKKEILLEEEISKYNTKLTLVAPTMKPGAVIEIEFLIISPLLHVIDPFLFQYGIPVDRVDFHFETPEFYSYNTFFKGSEKIEITRSLKIEKVLLGHFERTIADIRTVGTTNYQPREMDVKMDVWDFSLTDVPSLKDPGFVKNIWNYRSSLILELAYVDYFDSPREYVSANWTTISKEVFEDRFFYEEMERSKAFKTTIPLIIGTEKDPLRKGLALYQYVSQNIKWNNIYGRNTERGIDNSFDQKIGNVGDINLMLTAMLKSAGLNANPIILGSVNKGMPIYPSLQSFNSVLASFQYEGKTIVLDGTNPNLGLNLVSKQFLNGHGRLIYSDGTSVSLKINPTEKSMNLSSIEYEVLENGLIKGTESNVLDQYLAVEFNEEYPGLEVSNVLVGKDRKYEGARFFNGEIKSFFWPKKKILIKSSFEIDEASEIYSDRISFSPFIFRSLNELPFVDSVRKVPVEFYYPVLKKSIFRIHFPEGYRLEKIPESKILTLPNGMGKYKCIFSEVIGGLQILVSESLNSDIIYPKDFKALFEFYQNIFHIENQKIVILKKGIE